MKDVSYLKLNELFQQAKQVKYHKGDIILRPEDSSSYAYFIEQGSVKVYSLTEWGDEKIHILYKTGEMFPLLWIFDQIPISKYYEAIEDITLKKVSREEFLQYCKEHTDFLFEVTKKIISMMDVFTDRVENLEYTKASARLISRLLYLAKRFGEQNGKQIKIVVPLTHKDIANTIAMTRETASREFTKLEKKKLIGYESHHIIIYDKTKLEAELSKDYEKEAM